MDPRLDLASEHFDPEACLNVADPSLVKVPYPNVTDLKSIKRCISLVPNAVREEVDAEIGGLKRKVGAAAGHTSTYNLHVSSCHTLQAETEHAAAGVRPMCGLWQSGATCAYMQEKSEEQKQRDAEKKAFMIQRATDYMKHVDRAAAYDPIQTIIQRVRKGPLMLLRRAYQNALQIDVVTRHARGIKSIMRGQLHGFDKFMNLLLADVDEWMAHRAPVVRIKPKRDQQQGSSVAQAEAASPVAGTENAALPQVQEGEQHTAIDAAGSTVEATRNHAKPQDSAAFQAGPACAGEEFRGGQLHTESEHLPPVRAQPGPPGELQDSLHGNNNCDRELSPPAEEYDDDDFENMQPAFNSDVAAAQPLDAAPQVDEDSDADIEVAGLELPDTHAAFATESDTAGAAQAAHCPNSDAASLGATSDAAKQRCLHVDADGNRVQTRLGWQQVLRRRKLSRLMLRGDNVVTISLAVGPMRLPSALAHLTPPESSADKAVDTRNVKHEA